MIDEAATAIFQFTTINSPPPFDAQLSYGRYPRRYSYGFLRKENLLVLDAINGLDNGWVDDL